MVARSNCENGDPVVEKNRRIRTRRGGGGGEREEKRSNGQQGDPARQFKLRQMGTTCALQDFIARGPFSCDNCDWKLRAR